MRTRRRKHRKTRRPPVLVRAPRGVPAAPTTESLTLLDEGFQAAGIRAETNSVLTGGDVDADWHRAGSTGEEAVGGSVATPDQDVVDELGRALGVEQESDAELHPTSEILEARDRHYWHLERKAETDEE